MEEVAQTITSAASVAPAKTSAPRSVFDWRPAGSPTPSPSPESEASMATKKPARKARPIPTAGRKARLIKEAVTEPGTKPPLRASILSVLATKVGLWDRDSLRSAFEEIEDKPFSQCLYQLKAANQVRKIGDSYEITKDGLARVEKLRTLDGSDAKFAKPTRARRPVALPPPSAAAPPASTGVRCAFFSDGSFVLEKSGNAINLTPQEAGEMRAYLDAR